MFNKGSTVYVEPKSLPVKTIYFLSGRDAVVDFPSPTSSNMLSSTQTYLQHTTHAPARISLSLIVFVKACCLCGYVLCVCVQLCVFVCLLGEVELTKECRLTENEVFSSFLNRCENTPSQFEIF